MNAPDRDTRTTSLAMAALALLPALVLGLLRSVEQTPDGLSYALDVRAGTGLWHPHHLIYAPVARLLFVATPLDALGACVAQNLLALPLLAWAGHGLATRLTTGRLMPLLATALLLSTRGVMYYATHAETYLPALAWTAVALRLATAPRLHWPGLATAVALAVLHHQTNVLLAGVLLAMAGGDAARRRSTIVTLSAAGAFVLAVYAGAYLAVADGSSFFGFVFRYARSDVPAWGNLGNIAPVGLAKMAVSQARNLVPVPETWARPAALAALFGLAVVVVAAWRRRSPADQARALSRGALVMLGLYLPFFLWWMPGDPDFFLITVLPLWLLGLVLTGGGGLGAKPAFFGGLLALLAAGNLIFTVWPMHSEPGPTHRRAMALHASAPAAAALVVGYGLEQELLYHTDRIGVREGHAFCAEGGASNPPAAPLVIGRGFLDELLAAPTAGCLARLLEHDPDGGRRRAFAALPGGIGLLVAEAWVETGSRADLAADVRRELAKALP